MPMITSRLASGWPRYSARALLAAVTMLCIVLALLVAPAQRQRRTADKLRVSNPPSRAMYDYEFHGGPKPSGPDWLRRWIGDDYFQHVTRVELVLDGRNDVTPDDLADLRGLEQLSIEGAPLPNSRLNALGRLRKLEYLSIDSDELTDHGLEQLSGVTALEQLNVESDQVTGEGLHALAALKHLRVLILTSDGISPRGFEAIAQLESLEILYLNSNRLTDGCLEALSSSKNLRELRISRKDYSMSGPPTVTDASLRYIARLSSLRRLRIRYAPITDSGLAHLAALGHLVELDLTHHQPQYSRAGVARLQAKLPAMKVSAQPRH
jgi:hypothetical protein